MKPLALLLRLRVIAACVGAAGLVGFAAAAPAARVQDNRPNVVFILADDLGWRDLACYGNTLVDTPRIDSLARDGMRFTQAYAYPTCSPTRVSLMTGDYPSRHGMSLHLNPHRRGWEKLSPPASPCGLAPATTSLADVIAPRNYTSTLIGKWHLGYGNNPFNWQRVEMPPELGPNTPRVAFGFTRPPETKAGGIGANYESRLQAFAADNPGKSLGTQTLQAVRFIEQNRNQPFFFYVAYSSVHVPLAVRPDLALKYQERTVARNALPDPRYLGMIEAVDESVGLILDALDELKLSENTIVIFASDNGGLIQDYYGAGPVITDMHPLRGQKSTLWEAGLRVPWIVRWPNVTKPGSTSSEPILCTDFFPTLADMTGARLPDKYSRDGVSLVPLLRSPTMKLPSRELYWHLPAYLHVQSSPSSAVRDGDHKLIEFLQDGHVELYNLVADPGEDHDLAAEQPARAAQLRHKLHAWRAAVGAEMPTPNPNYDPGKAAIWTVRPKHPWDPAPLEPRKDLPSRYFTPSAVE